MAVSLTVFCFFGFSPRSPLPSGVLVVFFFLLFDCLFTVAATVSFGVDTFVICSLLVGRDVIGPGSAESCSVFCCLGFGWCFV